MPKKTKESEITFVSPPDQLQEAENPKHPEFYCTVSKPTRPFRGQNIDAGLVCFISRMYEVIRLRAGQRFHVVEPIGRGRNKGWYYRVESHVDEEAY